MPYILSLDQGTTGTTACLIEATTLQFLDKVNEEYPQIYPRPGEVEHNLEDIWKSVGSTVKKLLEKNSAQGSDVIAIGITNQRETICAFDEQGRPLYNAIVWQDRRTSEQCDQLKKNGLAPLITERTGLPVDPYFSATKIKWLIDHVPMIKKLNKEKKVKFGTIDTFLLYRLTNGASFKTDASNASRTLLCRIDKGEWDPDLLRIFGVEAETLPTISDSFSTFGITKNLSFLPDGIPINAILGDQQSALFGQGCLLKGDIKCTYGTGAFALLNTGSTLVRSTHGLLTTIAFKHEGKITYALEGSSYIAGAAVQWLRDNLKLFVSSKEVEQLARSLPDLSHVEHILFLPFFTGMGSPHWNANAKAAIVGLSRDSSKEHLARACLEGIAFSINDLLDAMALDLGSPIARLRVDGGASANNLLMEIQSTASNLTIRRPKVIETTAYGAALGAALTMKMITIEELSKRLQVEKEFTPLASEREYINRKLILWNRTIKKLYS